MNLKDALSKYHQQESRSKIRGIEWELTFAQWLAWWGGDLDRRGSHPDSLQMCRKADTGPYAIGNIYKGTPKENARTAGNMRRKRATDKAKLEHQAHLDALMWVTSKEGIDEIPEDQIELLKATGAIRMKTQGPKFAIDKNR